jgi:GAF domain-containing protein
MDEHTHGSGRLHDSERQYLLERHENALLELAKHELKTDDLDVALRTLAEAAGQTLNVERASIWMFDDERTKITCLDLYELSTRSHSKGIELLASEYPTYFEALEQNRTLVASDARADARTRELTATYLVPHRVEAMLDAPIRVDGRVVGIVCHEHVVGVRQWTLEEQRFAGSMADMAALALEHVERVRVEREVERRDELLDGVAKAANRMFAEAEGQVSHRDALLAALSSATAALIAAPRAGDGVAEALAIATTTLACTRVAVHQQVESTFDDLGLGSWREVLHRGLAVTAPKDGGSRYVVPVRTSLGLWGVVEATADAEREWSASEEYFLRTLGNALAGALTSRN